MHRRQHQSLVSTLSCRNRYHRARITRLVGQAAALTAAAVLVSPGGLGQVVSSNPRAIDRQVVAREACTVQPRRERDLIRLALEPEGIARALLGQEPVATPEPPPPGKPADPEIVASVNVTAEQLVACYNSGDLRRLFALYSQDYLNTVWGGFAGPNPSREQVREAIAFMRTPVPQTPGDRISLISVQDVQELADGRVMAVLNLSTGSLLATFRYSDGWYQLDWAYPLP